MPPARNPSGEPADVTVDIAQRAWEGTVVSAVLVPIFQLVFLEMAEAMHPLSTSAIAADPMAILYTGVVVLGLIPVVSTVVSTVVAYGAAGWPGVMLYYLMSVGASMMLGAELTGAIIFMTGIMLFLLVAAFKARSSQRQRRPPRRPL